MLDESSCSQINNNNCTNLLTASKLSSLRKSTAILNKQEAKNHTDGSQNITGHV